MLIALEKNKQVVSGTSIRTGHFIIGHKNLYFWVLCTIYVSRKVLDPANGQHSKTLSLPYGYTAK